MISDNEKGNRYHDEKGRFASGSGNKASEINDLSDYAKYKESLKTALKGVLNKLESFRGKPAGSYDVVTGEKVDLPDGYMVSFHQNEPDENGHYKSHFGRYTPEEYDRLALQLALDNDVEVYIGTYDDDPEISYKVKTEDEAQKIAEENNQKSYYNNAEQKEIPNPKYDKTKNPMHED